VYAPTETRNPTVSNEQDELVAWTAEGSDDALALELRAKLSVEILHIIPEHIHLDVELGEFLGEQVQNRRLPKACRNGIGNRSLGVEARV
jgi:hypothetical protein